jgi:hypothetical protein
MTHFVNPKEVGSDLVAHLANMTKRGADQIGGADYTLENEDTKLYLFCGLGHSRTVLHAVRSLNDEH